jgi:aminoglycoside phosphotransferase family enzyme/predicted kinase
MSGQDAVIRFLSDPGNYPDPSGFEVHQTHASWVFLAGPHAYKLKKALSLGFFDYSTPERRRHYCEEEVRLNRRLAPGIYLGVLPVLEEDGRLSLGGLAPGAPRDPREVDAVVLMKRLPREAMLDHMLAAGSAGEEHADRIVAALASFYGSSPRSADIDRMGDPAVIRGNLVENFEQTEDFVGDLIAAGAFRAIRSSQLSFLEIRRRLFEERVEGGRIRDGHGDLRAEHIAFLPGIVIVDCIEFADRFRECDVAADLAFLAMDLEFLGHAGLAERLVRRFVEVTGDRGLEGVLGFYVSYRAYVRGKVDGIKLRQPEVDREEKERLHSRVRRYFELAHAHARRFHRPLLVSIGGLSGTGKSMLARLLGARLGADPIRSDEVRKEIHGGMPPAVLYSADATRRTYEAVADRARLLLAHGGTAIADATFSLAWQRKLARDAALAAGAEWVHIECRVPPAVAAERMRRRAEEGKDVSDATEAIQERQREAYDPPAEGAAIPIDASPAPEAVLEAAMAALRARA